MLGTGVHAVRPQDRFAKQARKAVDGGVPVAHGGGVDSASDELQVLLAVHEACKAAELLRGYLMIQGQRFSDLMASLPQLTKTAA